MSDEFYAVIPVIAFTVTIITSGWLNWRATYKRQIACRSFTTSVTVSLTVLLLSWMDTANLDPFILYAMIMQALIFGLVAFIVGLLLLGLRRGMSR
jgi:hypothetical protein